MMELFQQIINDPRLTSHHVSLYFAILIEQIDTSGPFIIQRDNLMIKSKIRSKDKFFSCLHQLHQWGYIHYQRGNRYAPSTASTIPEFGNLAGIYHPNFIVDKAQIPENRNYDNHQIPENRNYESCQSPENRNYDNHQIPENRNYENCQSPENRNYESRQSPENGNYESRQIPENGNYESRQIPENRNYKCHQIPENRNLASGVYVQNADNQNDSILVPKNEQSKPAAPSPPSSSSTFKRSNNNIFFNDDDVAAVGDDVPRARSKKLPTDHPFSESPYFDWPTFEATFSDGSRYRNVDLRYYYDALCDWRDRDSGLPPLRSDWLRTARVFMRNDAKQNKLALKSPPPDAHKPAAKSSTAKIINNDKYGPSPSQL